MFQQLFAEIDSSNIDPGMVVKYNSTPTAYLKTLKLFSNNHQNAFKSIETNLENNPKEAYRIAHTLKGLSKLLGSNNYFEVCDNLLKKLKQAESSNNYFEELEALRIQHRIIVEDVKNILNIAQKIESRKSPSPGKKTIGRSELEQKLKELTVLVENNDTKAISDAENLLNDYIINDSHTKILEEILDLLENYQFEQAKLKIQKLLM